MHSQEDYFLAHYVAGLAVECHLRAYLELLTDQFNARHDLRELAKEADYYSLVPRNQEEDFSAVFETLNLRWRSNHRYYSERQLLDYMSEIRAGFNQSGDRWKNLSRTLLDLADRVIRQREAKWNNR